MMANSLNSIDKTLKSMQEDSKSMKEANESILNILLQIAEKLNLPQLLDTHTSNQAPSLSPNINNDNFKEEILNDVNILNSSIKRKDREKLGASKSQTRPKLEFLAT